jgi:hypothetical protein
VAQTPSGVREASVVADGRFAEPTGWPAALDNERCHLASNRRVNPYRNGMVKRTLHPKSKSINMPISWYSARRRTRATRGSRGRL